MQERMMPSSRAVETLQKQKEGLDASIGFLATLRDIGVIGIEDNVPDEVIQKMSTLSSSLETRGIEKTIGSLLASVSVYRETYNEPSIGELNEVMKEVIPALLPDNLAADKASVELTINNFEKRCLQGDTVVDAILDSVEERKKHAAQIAGVSGKYDDADLVVRTPSESDPKGNL